MAHDFRVDVSWSGELRGEAVPEGVDRPLPLAVPEAFGGPGGEWTPEHLLAASVNSCVFATFLMMAKASKLEFAAYRAAGTVHLEKAGAGLRVTRVELAPEIEVADESARDRAERLIAKAETMCPISNALEVEVSLNPSVTVRGG